MVFGEDFAYWKTSANVCVTLTRQPEEWMLRSGLSPSREALCAYLV